MICTLHFITTIDIMMHTLLHMRSMRHRLTVLFLIHASILCLVPNTHVSAQSTDGFVSIDCGSSETKSYPDALGITWTPDAVGRPGIDRFSNTIQGIPLTTPLSKGQTPYGSMRYFQPGKAMNASKFCYSLDATGGSYYLVRAAFWSGGTQFPYNTRTNDAVRFQMIVDTYEGQEIVISLPQSDVWIEEMYVRAQSLSVMVCLSAASDTSDAPFINSLELRPLNNNALGLVSMVKSTNTAIRLVDRQDFGGTSTNVLRYPNDIYDRIWYTTASIPDRIFQETDKLIEIKNSSGIPPQSVVQSIVTARNINYTISPSSTSSPLTRTTTTGQHNYSVMLYFCEINKGVVNQPGQRLFNLTLNIGNSVLISETLDIFARVGAQYLLEVSTGAAPVGPYAGDINIQLVTLPSLNNLTASIAGAEVLQLLSNPMLTPTSSSDSVAIRDISALYNFSSLIGDPCLPLTYKYPWLNCTSTEQPPRVASLFLSNYGLTGAIPGSINNLERISEIYLDQNVLSGPLPDLSKLVNLQTLSLSYNKLSGSIPDTLAKLPKLTYLDVRYNQLSGEIPELLLQKAANGQLTFRYEGNDFQKKQSRLPLIIGVVVGVVVVLCVTIVCIVIVRRRRRRTLPPTHVVPSPNKKDNPTPNNDGEAHQPDPYATSIPEDDRPEFDIKDPNAARRFKFEEIITATNNFSTIIGRGGFGTVYKGILQDGGKVIAVKVSSHASQQGSDQFLNEVALLSRVHHRNLVRLLGYCTEQRLVLVYEFMPNGSLFERLFGTSLAPASIPLTWIQRLQILLDAARGLAYLHDNCDPPIIHMDVKSSNILITENWEGKMSDFGISKPNSSDGDIPMPTNVPGTWGYMDPELPFTSTLSEKADIYSFGIVLFEALCGKPALIKDQGDASRTTRILDWATPYLRTGKIREMVEKAIGSSYNDLSSVWKVADTAMACVKYAGNEQPTMNEVCRDLEEAMRFETTGAHLILTNTEVYSNVKAR